VYEQFLDKIKKLTSSLLANAGVELVELFINRERGRSILRLLVDKPGGVTLGECARFNREIGNLLDKENIIQESYVLEVSSPGLGRPMKSTRDFQRNLEKLVKIILHQPIDRENVWKGILNKVGEENIVIETERGKMLSIPRRNIARANLEVRF